MRNSHIIRGVAVALAVAALAGCAGRSTAPVMDHWTPAPAGASWSVQQRNTGSFGQDAKLTWTREDMRWKGAPAIGLRGSHGMTIVAEPVGGSFIAVVGAEGKPAFTNDPPIGWVYPVKVGNSWTQHERMSVHSTGKTLEFDYSCKVEDFEKVVVPAGSFDAFRIHCTNSIGSDEVYWTSPGLGSFVKTQLKRDASSPFGAGTQEQELVSRPMVRNAG